MKSGGIHKIEGYVYGNQLFFEETEAIVKRTDALNCKYALNPKGADQLSGTYNSCSNGGGSGYTWIKCIIFCKSID